MTCGQRRTSGLAGLSFLALNGILVTGFWAWGNLRPIVAGHTTSLDWRVWAQVLGRLAGLWAAFCVLMQVCLISRAPWLERAFGFDRLTRVHARIGMSIPVLLLFHFGLLLAVNAAFLDNSLWTQFVAFLREYDGVAAAFAAFVLFAIVVATSWAIVRRRLKYEAWYAVHLLTYAAVLLAFGHQLAVGQDFQNNPAFRTYWVTAYVFAFGNLILYRLAHPLIVHARHRFRVERVVRETHDVVSVYIVGRQPGRWRWQAGQFGLFRFLSRSLRWQSHPFSISCTPEEGMLRISVKAVGDFTCALPDVPPGTHVLIDGPLGLFTGAQAATGKVLFIAGGIGITPIRAMMGSLAQSGADVVLIYGNRTTKDIVFEKELSNLAQQASVAVHHVLSQEPTWPGERSRIDIPMIRRLVPDFAERDIFLCGPPPMMLTLVAALEVEGVRAKRIHFERFAL